MCRGTTGQAFSPVHFVISNHVGSKSIHKLAHYLYAEKGFKQLINSNNYCSTSAEERQIKKIFLCNALDIYIICKDGSD